MEIIFLVYNFFIPNPVSSNSKELDTVLCCFAKRTCNIFRLFGSKFD